MYVCESSLVVFNFYPLQFVVPILYLLVLYFFRLYFRKLSVPY